LDRIGEESIFHPPPHVDFNLRVRAGMHETDRGATIQFAMSCNCWDVSVTSTSRTTDLLRNERRFASQAMPISSERGIDRRRLVKITNLCICIFLLVCFCGCGVLSKNVKKLPNDQYGISFSVVSNFGVPSVPPTEVLDEIAYGVCTNGYKVLKESTSWSPVTGRSYYYVIMCNSSHTSGGRSSESQRTT
jgi:hypothetical protein